MTVYKGATDAFTWKKAGYNVAFHAYEIAVGNVEDREAAIEEIRRLVELVNRTWERRGEITPSPDAHQRPTPMAIYTFLPRINCKACGEATCFTFALRLAASQVQVESCSALFEPEHAQALQELRSILIDGPSIG